MKKHIGFVGLGKMGLPMSGRLAGAGFEVRSFDVSGSGTDSSLEELARNLESPRRVFVMVPHGAVRAVVTELLEFLEEGDTIFEGGNSYYKETQLLAEMCKEKGVNLMDVGVSGGPGGALRGACLMVGGDKKIYQEHEDVFQVLAVENGYAHVGAVGAGHFVKMVHNGIEYGMMQAMAEGFAVMEASEFSLNLTEISDLFSHGSVIESRLVDLLKEGFDEFGEALEGVSGSVSQSGAGAWTSKTAAELGVETPIIDGSVEFRNKSEHNPSFTGKLLSALRNRFGGHSITDYSSTS